jgi:hypothetical protein
MHKKILNKIKYRVLERVTLENIKIIKTLKKSVDEMF